MSLQNLQLGKIQFSSLLFFNKFVASKKTIMKKIITIIALLFSCSTFSQTQVSGTVKDEFDNPIYGANIYLKGTYDGSTSDAKGNFNFETTEQGMQLLIISFLSYEILETKITIENYKKAVFILKESVNTLDAVVLSASTFTAGENSKLMALKPLDIVTTAGSAGNIIAALETLPGTQAVGESGKLYVRGGEANETQTYVDGIKVAQPYGVSANNLPTRSKFSPFLFKGITFSSGGYSAEYGNALSSVLLLDTKDEPTSDQTDISIMTLGFGLSKTKKWKTTSFTFNTSYVNLKPYQLLIPQKNDWKKPVEIFGGETVFRKNFKNGIFKIYTTLDATQFNLFQKDINYDNPIQFGLNNLNFYTNSSYKGWLTNKLQLQTGIGFGYSQNKIKISLDDLQNKENALHMKFKLKQSVTKRITITGGSDYFQNNNSETFQAYPLEAFQYGFKHRTIAFFGESEIYFSKKMAINLGVRSSNVSLIKGFTAEPRISYAYKITDNSQISLAYGKFNQLANADYLKYASQLNYEKATHYIVNYMFNIEGNMLRVETYYKKYDGLVKFNSQTANFTSQFSNSGNGYAKGVDVFWRDSKAIKNFEYWLSYSFIDSKRDFKNYSEKVTPSFIAKHNLSIVNKYFIKSLRSQVSTTYNFNSGRPYNNPNSAEFMSEKTKSFSNLSLSWAYLISQQKILYFSVSNILNNHAIYGYQYANQPNARGEFQRQAVTPPANQFVFVGFFWTINSDKKTNNLNNL